ncbi:LD-carboxypeptidase [Plantactinospora sp. S1510]|uniref:LD-carboxypeptidase n=1 Tax=Plantactinospora alkalitolerans TaxID=2789879 RepID=A0ABS0H1M2_9ACTN|nr:S66 peptidase family protein [Plantactinospora alkalitolerans]MBF9132211.1 LD-carboxypeptidase [Plantactinospora alkalitolerans]
MKQELRLPPRLRAGDVVAVATPSGPSRTPGRLARGVAALRELGFEVVVGPMARTADPAERGVEARAAELNGFINDPTVRAVFVGIGGHLSNATLPHLDFAALRERPKVICGYSDITAILLGCYAQAQVVTFHGPTLLPELGEFPMVLPYTAERLWSVVGRSRPAGRLVAPDAWTDEFHAWDVDDNRAREMRPSGGWSWLSGGRGSGPLVGGNLETISALAGTPYLPDFTDAVVFLETAGANIDEIERLLTHLEMIGVFTTAAAVLFGRPFRAAEGCPERLRALLRRTLGTRLPVVADVDLGHTDPMLTLPIGVHATVDADARTLELTDAAVG